MAKHATYEQAKAIAGRIDDMMLARYRETVRAAGLDPSIAGIHVNNALCDYSYGHPWAGVDYSLVRKARWIDGKRSRVNKLLDAYYTRITRECPYPEYMHVLFPGQCKG